MIKYIKVLSQNVAYILLYLNNDIQYASFQPTAVLGVDGNGHKQILGYKWCCLWYAKKELL